MPTVVELKAEAKRRGIPRYSTMKKAELEKVLKKPSSASKRKSPAKKASSAKKCPQGKVRNTVTGRCRNKCTTAQRVDHETGACVSKKMKPFNVSKFEKDIRESKTFKASTKADIERIMTQNLGGRDFHLIFPQKYYEFILEKMDEKKFQGLRKSSTIRTPTPDTYEITFMGKRYF
jgi:hypothetical protein